MADSSWDNGGQPLPSRPGLPLWSKIAMGCGAAVLVLLATCVGGIAYLSQGGGKKVLGLALNQMGPEWADLQEVVDQLRTEEGSRALYGANPELAKTWATEAAFLEVAAGWRKDLPPRTELSPDLMQNQGLHINRALGGRVTIGWSPRSGRAIYVTFERARKAGDQSPRRVVELDVR
jgi:hypothetical protein